MHKYNYTYKITNTITKEFYVGVRSCDCEIEEDKYMGSSSIWTKVYIKEHKKELKKEIIETFETRKLANYAEVELLKSVENDPLCINQYFDFTPDLTGIKQTPEWIKKRIKYGKEHGMFGKHHTEETKKRISEKLKGRKLTEEHKEKIRQSELGREIPLEVKEKMSKAKSKIRHIENIKTGETWDISITEFIKMFPNEGYNANSMRKAAQQGCIYRKMYRITECEALEDNTSNEKSGENGELPVKENPVGSNGSE